MQQAGLRARLGYTGGGVAPDAAAGEDDDWLSDVGDVDWEDSAADRIAPSRGNGQSAAGWSLVGGRAVAETDAHAPAAGRLPPDVVQRRRALAALVLVLVVGAAIAVPLLAFRGGGSPQAESTLPTTTPPATTTPPTASPSTSSAPQAKPSLTVQLPSSGLLKVGVDEPALVTTLQRALTRLGYDLGKADGTFGPATKEAVIAFQQANGLSADGVVGADTARALNAALAKAG